MPGRADFSSRPSDSRLTAAVTSLARLHLAMASFEPAGAERTWFVSGNHDLAPAVSERHRAARGLVGRQAGVVVDQARAEHGGGRGIPCGRDDDRCRRFIGVREAIAEELDAAQRFRVPVQPCLRDVWHDHILFDGDAVSGIIDPAAARTDTVAADISRLVGSLVSG